MSKVNLMRCKSGILLAGIIFLTTLNSCLKEEIDNSGKDKQVAAVFRTTINDTGNKKTPATRASGNQWEAGDEIGVYALIQGATAGDYSIYNEKENIRYINNINGNLADFQAAGEEIIFPVSKENLKFIAYYPYTSTGTSGSTLQIDVTEQSNPSEIDVLYAQSTDYNCDNPEVSLTFHHILSHLVIEVATPETINLEGAQITIHNTVNKGTINLEDGTVTPDTESSLNSPIIPFTTFDQTENKITATAILLPGWDFSKAEIQINTADNNTYIWQSDEYLLQPNIIRTYQLNLTSASVELIAYGSTISDWGIDPTIISKDIQPVEKVGETDSAETGSRENPYTVSQVLAMDTQTEPIWIKGYIMGWVRPDMFDIKLLNQFDEIDETYSPENIVLAENPTATETSQMIAVEFNKETPNDPQTFLNLHDNFELIGREVKVYCTTGTKSQPLWGLNIIDYELV